MKFAAVPKTWKIACCVVIPIAAALAAYAFTAQARPWYAHFIDPPVECFVIEKTLEEEAADWRREGKTVRTREYGSRTNPSRIDILVGDDRPDVWSFWRNIKDCEAEAARLQAIPKPPTR